MLEKEGWLQKKQDKLILALESDYRTAEVPGEDMAMLDYVVKLTRTPSEINENDVKKLRAVGFDDRGIHDICASTSYFAFVNRIADGLGVALE